MEWYLYPAVVVAGFAAGYINTLAGSGSLITLSLLIFMGVPANVANGTNRVGILFQGLSSVTGFYRQDVMDTRGGLILSVPAVIGALLGAQTAVNLNETIMERTIGVLMLIMLVVIIVRPNRWLEGEREKFETFPSVFQLVSFFLIGIYGGFIQAGVGIFLLAGLVLGAGYNLVRANAVKMLINLIFTVFALGVFIYNDQVWWGIGLLLAVGNASGGWIAAKMAVERGAEFVRYVLIAVVVVSAVQFLDLPALVIGWFS